VSEVYTFKLLNVSMEIHSDNNRRIILNRDCSICQYEMCACY